MAILMGATAPVDSAPFDCFEASAEFAEYAEAGAPSPEKPAAVASDVYYLERCADSGAATGLASKDGLLKQGVPEHVVDSMLRPASKPVNFATGAGPTASTETISMETVAGAGADDASVAYMMPGGCSLVTALRERVIDEDWACIWHPRMLQQGGVPHPFFIRPDHLQAKL